MEEMHIGKRIKQLLKEHRTSVQNFADLIEYQRSSVYTIQEKKNVSTEIIYKSCIALNISYLEFFDVNISSPDVINSNETGEELRSIEDLHSKLYILDSLKDKLKVKLLNAIPSLRTLNTY